MTAYECLILLPVLSISLQYPLFPHLQPDTGSDNGLKILLPCYSRPLSDLRSLHPIHPWQVLHLFSSRTFPVPSDLDLFPYRDIVRVYSEFLLSVFPDHPDKIPEHYSSFFNFSLVVFSRTSPMDAVPILIPASHSLNNFIVSGSVISSSFMKLVYYGFRNDCHS